MIIYSQSMGKQTLEYALANGLETNVARYNPDYICLQRIEKDYPKCFADYEEYPSHSYEISGSATITYVKKKIKQPLLHLNDPLNGMGRGMISVIDYTKYRILNITGYYDFGEEDYFEYRRFFWTRLLQYIPEVYKVNDLILIGDLDLVPRRIETSRKEKKAVRDKDKKIYNKILRLGFRDVWRKKHPRSKQYTHQFDSNNPQVGERTTYCFVPNKLFGKIKYAKILPIKYSSGLSNRPLLVNISD